MRFELTTEYLGSTNGPEIVALELPKDACLAYLGQELAVHPHLHECTRLQTMVSDHADSETLELACRGVCPDLPTEQAMGLLETLLEAGSSVQEACAVFFRAEHMAIDLIAQGLGSAECGSCGATVQGNSLACESFAGDDGLGTWEGSCPNCSCGETLLKVANIIT